MPGVLAASRALASPAAPGGRPFGLPLTRLRAPGLAALTFRGRAPEHHDKGHTALGPHDLYKVALREAWALGRRQRREQPVGGLNGADEDGLEPVDLDSDVADVVAERIEHAGMREVLGRLHWRERRELALFACGLTYEEIAAVTATSYTAVNRWMARGRNALRAADARRHLSDDDPDGPAR